MASLISGLWRISPDRNWSRHKLLATVTGKTIKRIYCADGFSMSVQAGLGKRSTPNIMLDNGNYSEWEVGFPSHNESLLLPYAEDANDPLNTVYPYVPTRIVDAIIAKHGGIKKE